MSRLIKASNFKLRKSTFIYVLIIITAVMVFGGVCLFHVAISMMSDGSLFEMAGGYDTDVEAFNDLSFIDCTAIALSLMQVLSILIAVAVTINISQDKEDGSIVVAAAKGSTRKQIYVSRLYETIVISFALYLTEVVSAVVGGIIFMRGSVDSDDVAGFIKFILITMLMYITVGIIFMNIALSIKSGGVAIAVNLLIFIFGISICFTLIDTSINGDVGVIRKYWIFTAIEQLADIDITWTDILKGFLNIIVYGGLSIVAGYRHFYKSTLM